MTGVGLFGERTLPAFVASPTFDGQHEASRSVDFMERTFNLATQFKQHGMDAVFRGFSRVAADGVYP